MYPLESTFPPGAVWHLLGMVGAIIFYSRFYVQRAEWIFAAGSAAVILIYLRNLSLLKNQTQEVTSIR